MRALVQRVKQASVEIDGRVTASIKNGLLVFLGIKAGDTSSGADYLLKKILSLRIFNDENGKMNLSLKEINGEVLLVSQFTLYADTVKGNRPSYSAAMPPSEAEPLFELTAEKLRSLHDKVQTGIFGADMKVSLLNDGPVTIILDSPQN
jgi:D-tyrosyl-tRNA(Tyr) deacylase